MYYAKKIGFAVWLAWLAIAFPLFMSPSIIIVCGPTMIDAPKCERVGATIWLSYMDRIQYWADHNEYGFSNAR